MDKTLLFAVINFTIFGAALYFLLRKPASQALLQRNQKIVEDINLSKEMKHFAAGALKEGKNKIGHLEKDKSEVCENLTRNTKHFQSAQEKYAQEELARIQKEAQKRSEQTSLKLKEALEKEMRRVLLEATLKKMKQELTQEMHESLNSEYVKSLQHTKEFKIESN